MGQAQLIAVVGPSGVGKDTVMAAVETARPEIRLVRRVITRDGEAGGEDFVSVGEAEFEQMAAAGQFALSWRAHGLFYGIPRQEVEGRPDGEIRLVNLSRGVLAQARGQFESFRVLSLVASAETLASRLAARGREGTDDIAKRLERAGYARPTGDDVIEVANDGTLEDTVKAVLERLYPVRA